MQLCKNTENHLETFSIDPIFHWSSHLLGVVSAPPPPPASPSHPFPNISGPDPHAAFPACLGPSPWQPLSTRGRCGRGKDRAAITGRGQVHLISLISMGIPHGTGEVWRCGVRCCHIPGLLQGHIALWVWSVRSRSVMVTTMVKGPSGFIGNAITAKVSIIVIWTGIVMKCIMGSIPEKLTICRRNTVAHYLEY